MLVLFLCLLSLTPVMTRVGLGGKALQFPTKTDSSYVKLTPEKPLSLSAFTLCMRVTMERQFWRDVILFAYRTNNRDELNVWKELDGRVTLYIQSSKDAAYFSWVPHYRKLHLCITWSNWLGATSLWVDGEYSSFSFYRNGHTIHPGGTVLLGQDPDDYVGRYDAEQSFVGKITDVYMWDRVLLKDEIRAMYLDECDMPKGNVFDWKTIKYAITGNVQVVEKN